jgi:diaminopimelate decarboxylase
MLSDRDLAAAATTGCRFIVDSFSAIRRLGPLLPRDRAIGVRVDPALAAGYNRTLSYSGGKLGVDLGEMPAVVEAVRGAGLRLDTVHAHLGAALREADAPAFDTTCALLGQLARAVGATTVNVGGGLAIAYAETDRPLRPAHWAAAIRRHLSGLRVACEPGAFVAAPAGVLLVTVNTVERRRGRTWVGVDAGYALHPAPAMHGLGVAVIPVARPLEAPTARVDVAGNLNEPHDTWCTAVALPRLAEGDVLAIFPAGAYAQAMASDHCLRGDASAIAVG